MIVLNVTYKCKPGMNKAFLDRIVSEGIDVLCRADAGNIKYDYYLPADGSDELLLVEKWEDAASLAAHAATPHLARLGGFKNEYVINTVLEKFIVEK